MTDEERGDLIEQDMYSEAGIREEAAFLAEERRCAQRMAVVLIEGRSNVKETAQHAAATILDVEDLEGYLLNARRLEESYHALGLWSRANRFDAIARVFEARIARLIALGRS